MLAQVQLIGNVGRAPELTLTPDGTPVCKFSLAVNKRRGDKEETTWFNCTAWRGLAETLEKYVTQGSQLFVQGELAARSYTTRDGKPGVSLDVTIEKFSFVGTKKAQGERPANGSGSEQGDPFLPDFPDDI